MSILQIKKSEIWAFTCKRLALISRRTNFPKSGYSGKNKTAPSTWTRCARSTAAERRSYPRAEGKRTDASPGPEKACVGPNSMNHESFKNVKLTIHATLESLLDYIKTEFEDNNCLKDIFDAI